MSHEDKIKRRYFRFRPDDNTLAELSFGDDPDEFEPEVIGLVYEEAYKGCGVIILQDDRFEVGREVLVHCGDIEATKAIVRWVDLIDPNAMRLGLEYEIPDLKAAKRSK